LGSGSFPSPNGARGRVLAGIARARGASPQRVALAFLLRDPSVLIIPKAAQPAHVADNAEAAPLTLTEDEIRQVETAFPRGKPRSGLPML
jgi:diketogulonate reductase-like aldo/keto reductase